MYGKSFESKFQGSMVGKGALYFTVWDYIITFAKKSRVEVNPIVVAALIGGCTKQEVAAVLEEMQQPDPESRNKEQEGRKLIREGQFQYFVVSHEHYRKMRDEDERREYNRLRMAEYRERQKAKANGKKQGQAVTFTGDALADRREDPEGATMRSKGTVTG